MARRCGLPFYLVFSLSCLLGCDKFIGEDGFAKEPEVELDLEAIRKRGYLVALLDNNSISYFIYKGRPMGYEYELLKRLTDNLKVDLKIKLITGIEQAIDLLNKGEGDILAFPLTITQERTQYLAFTDTHFNTHQVLVQKKPANWRMQPPQNVEKKLIRNPVKLIGEEVHVMQGSSFKERMINLSNEVGGEIKIIEDSATAETESLIKKVATGEIKYTVTDQTIAMVNSFYYPNLDISTVLSLPQQIAWAVRTNSPELLKATNDWLKEAKRTAVFKVIYNKYFESPRLMQARITSDYSSLAGNRLSPFDDQLKAGAEQIGWDWRLIASVAYQESNFDPQVKSWAGAIGLMQVMPETGEYFHVNNLWDPNQNIKVGIKFLKFLDNQWAKTVPDPQERIKFVLASYNVGLSHVKDAQKLTRKYGKDPTVWQDNVEYFLSQKSNPKYFRDPVAVVGYCRCDGPIRYVKEVLQRYDEYKLRIEA
ncbi:MAG TPA: transporter substrate-binding domain-containing protein [Cyclobacteriaceae bacterium]|nr:transporter substrate-binding domain-containing protein [Cyclobacteriaceae bacterium]